MSTYLIRIEHSASREVLGSFLVIPLGTPLAEVEALVLAETLRMTGNNKTQAARILGVNPSTIFRKLKAGPALHSEITRKGTS